MANNDRVIKNPDPTWAADNKTKGKQIVTKTIAGSIGWNAEEVTRTLLSRDAFNKPGWRERIVIPEGQSLVVYESSLFIVQQGGQVIPSGSTVPTGSLIDIIFNREGSIEYGCKYDVVSGTTTNSYWFQNFMSVGSSEIPNHRQIQVIGNTQILGEAKKRSETRLASGVANIISVTIKGTSWGDKGYQEKTLTLGGTFSQIDDIEFYVGDQLTLDINLIDTSYDWANFETGNSPGNMYPVNKSQIVYNATDTGGTYKFNLIDGITYFGMTGVKQVKFYLYQPKSDNFEYVRVKILETNNLNLYKKVSIPTASSTINFGKNGTVGTHGPIYPGTKLQIYSTRTRYVTGTPGVSTTIKNPEPSLPSEPRGGNLEVTIPFEAGETGMYTVGLYWLEDSYWGERISLTYGSEDYSSFETWYNDVLVDQDLSYLNNRIHLVEASSTTRGLKLWLKQSWEFEFEQEGQFDGSNISYYDIGSYTDDPNPVFYVTDLPIGFAQISLAAQVTGWSNNGTNAVKVTGAAQNMYARVGPYPGSSSDFWNIKTKWTIRPEFVAVVGEG